MQGSMDEFLERWLRSSVAEMRADLDVARSRNPYLEYMIQVLDAQDRARDQITQRLARPWWGMI